MVDLDERFYRDIYKSDLRKETTLPRYKRGLCTHNRVVLIWHLEIHR